MDPGSLLSLLKASQTAVESSDLALRAAEEALTTAKAANTQAKAALKAVKEFSAGGEVKRSKCETCRKKKCLHGELLQESLCKDPSGFIVRAVGESWTAKHLGKIGKIISCNQSKKQKFLNVQWENLSRTENFTFSSKSGPKFVIECKLKPEFPDLQIKEKSMNERNSPLAINCPSCRFNPCQRGNFLTEAISNPCGLKVRSIGKSFPERYRDTLGTVIIKQGQNITLRWDNTGEIRENTISSKSGPRFIIECARVDKSVMSPANSSVSTGDPFEDVQAHDDNEMEDFIMLSSNKNPVIDIDDDSERKKLEGSASEFAKYFSDLCEYAHISFCSREGKVLNEDKQSALMDILAFNEEWSGKFTIVITNISNFSSISQHCITRGYPCFSLSFVKPDRNLVMNELEKGQILVTHTFVAQHLDISFTRVIFFDFPPDTDLYKKFVRINTKRCFIFSLFNENEENNYKNFWMTNKELPPWPAYMNSSQSFLIVEHVINKSY